MSSASEYKPCAECRQPFFAWESRWPSDFRKKTVCSSLCANRRRGRRQRIERMDRIADLRGCGYGEEEIARKMGILPATLERYIYRDRKMT